MRLKRSKIVASLILFTFTVSDSSGEQTGTLLLSSYPTVYLSGLRAEQSLQKYMCNEDDTHEYRHHISNPESHQSHGKSLIPELHQSYFYASEEHIRDQEHTGLAGSTGSY